MYFTKRCPIICTLKRLSVAHNIWREKVGTILIGPRDMTMTFDLCGIFSIIFFWLDENIAAQSRCCKWEVFVGIRVIRRVWPWLSWAWAVSTVSTCRHSSDWSCVRFTDWSWLDVSTDQVMMTLQLLTLFTQLRYTPQHRYMVQWCSTLSAQFSTNVTIAMWNQNIHTPSLSVNLWTVMSCIWYYAFNQTFYGFHVCMLSIAWFKFFPDSV